jgi:regulator of protease activity HflC (stomatin/prohibitin superfamily)
MLYFILTFFIMIVWVIIFFGVPGTFAGAPEQVKWTRNVHIFSSAAALGLFLIVTFFSSIVQVNTGSVGVVRTFGAVDTSRIYHEGAHFVLPWQQMFITDNRTEATELANPAESASKDLQLVHTNLVLNWHIQPDMIPEVLQANSIANDGGSGTLADKVLVPAILETFKAVISQYTAEELITKRALVSTAIADTLSAKLANYHIIVEALNITNFQFSAEFNASIEKKVTATQRALQAQADLVRIKTEAQQAVAEAQGKAEAIRIQAQAIQAQGGKEYVAMKAVEKWDGKLPVTVAGGTIPFLSIK